MCFNYFGVGVCLWSCVSRYSLVSIFSVSMSFDRLSLYSLTLYEVDRVKDASSPRLFYPASSFDLLKDMLIYNPNMRVTAADALDHPFFKEGGPPVRNPFPEGMDLSSYRRRQQQPSAPPPSRSTQQNE